MSLKLSYEEVTRVAIRSVDDDVTPLRIAKGADYAEVAR
jgi:hypothetical protein